MTKDNKVVPISKFDAGRGNLPGKAGAALRAYHKTITVLFCSLRSSAAKLASPDDLTESVQYRKLRIAAFMTLKNNKGVTVKTIGSSILAYFENANDALTASVEMQSAADKLNFGNENGAPSLFISVGMNTGTCKIGRKDIMGMPVDAAMDFAGMAGAGEILFCKDTHALLSDEARARSSFKTSAEIKTFFEPVDVYTAFWNKREIEAENEDPEKYRPRGKPPRNMHGGLRLLLVFSVPIILTFIVSQIRNIPDMLDKSSETRSINDTATVDPVRAAQRPVVPTDGPVQAPPVTPVSGPREAPAPMTTEVPVSPRGAEVPVVPKLKTKEVPVAPLPKPKPKEVPIVPKPGAGAALPKVREDPVKPDVREIPVALLPRAGPAAPTAIEVSMLPSYDLLPVPPEPAYDLFKAPAAPAYQLMRETGIPLPKVRKDSVQPEVLEAPLPPYYDLWPPGQGAPDYEIIQGTGATTDEIMLHEMPLPEDAELAAGPYYNLWPPGQGALDYEIIQGTGASTDEIMLHEMPLSEDDGTPEVPGAPFYDLFNGITAPFYGIIQGIGLSTPAVPRGVDNNNTR